MEYNSNTPNIVIDRDKFQQIMTNLIDNATKYSDDDKTVYINTEILEKYLLQKKQNNLNNSKSSLELNP